MSLYKCILFITYYYIHTLEITNASKVGLKLLESGIDSIPSNAVGLMFYVVANNTSDEDYDIELLPEQCCLKHNFDLDCDTMNIIGNSEEDILKGTTKTLKLVAPILNPYGRHGYCIFTSKFKSRNRRNYVEKNTVKIDFNLQLDHKEQFMELPNYVKKCKNIDEDPLNYCKPVKCDVYYNGKKPYYNRKRKRCTKTPACISNYRSEFPNVIYDPLSNACIYGRSIIDEDIEFIKSLEEPNDRNTYIKTNDLHVRNVTSPKFDDFLLNKYKEDQEYMNLINNCTHESIYANLKFYFVKNKLTIGILFTVVFIQCCLICALGYYVTNKCDCLRRQKKVCNLFNYKTDASLTTPLIFSNTNTDTTDYQYLSESSNNIMRKINCYKSCQKERCNDIKISISDDILSKCLTRRDWIDNKHTKSEAIQGLAAVKTRAENLKKANYNTSSNFNNKICPRVTEPTKKSCESKVVFKDETSIKNEGGRNSHKKGESITYTSSEDRMRNEKKDSDSIEKEIRSHSYDCLEVNADLDNANSNNCFQVYNNNKSIKLKEAVSLSSNKGAQACFSKDSIDDFLSERGMMLLAGEDFSKYSFSCPSNPAKPISSSEVSAKTSKNNIVRNMLTLLQKRSKQGISSDPGIATNNKQNIDLELLHMSRASVFTTSNDSECVKEFTKTHDSRTSL